MYTDVEEREPENNNILLSHYGYNILYYKQHLTYT